jgi:hypothetical protein
MAIFTDLSMLCGPIFHNNSSKLVVTCYGIEGDTENVLRTRKLQTFNVIVVIRRAFAWRGGGFLDTESMLYYVLFRPRIGHNIV